MTPNPRNATSANVLSSSTRKAARRLRGRSIAPFVRRRSGVRARRGRRRRARRRRVAPGGRATVGNARGSRSSARSRRRRRARRVRSLRRPPRSRAPRARRAAHGARSARFRVWRTAPARRRRARRARQTIQMRTCGQPNASATPAKPRSGEEAAHRRRVVPDVERRVKVLASRSVAAGGEIGLGSQAGPAVERRPLFGDAPLDDRHVVIGRQSEAVLHRQRRRVRYGFIAGLLRRAPPSRNALDRSGLGSHDRPDNQEVFD